MRIGAARLGALVLLALAGCGIATDAEPRDVPLDQQRNLVPADDDAAAEGSGTRIYLIDAAAPGQVALLRSVGRDVTPTATAVLEALLDGPTEGELDRRLRTAIPPDTELRSARFSSRTTLTVDLTEPIFEATGAELVDAVSQLVFTSSEVEGVQQVELRVDGELQEWPRGDGTLVDRPLTVFDFPGRVASSQPDYPTVVAPGAPG
jgi:spore germination protein GerM